MIKSITYKGFHRFNESQWKLLGMRMGPLRRQEEVDKTEVNHPLW